MPKRFHLERPDLAKGVAEALAHCRNVKDQQRLLAMRLAAGGQMTSAQIAEQLGISRRQFFNWVSALKAGGVAALLEREHGGGAPARIKGPLREQLLAGLQKGQWKRAKEIQAWLKHEHQTSLSLKGVYYWLGKIGRSLEGAAQDSRRKRRGPNHRVSADAVRAAQELERGWWKAGPHLGGR